MKWLPKIFDKIYTIVTSVVVMFGFSSISCCYAYIIETSMYERLGITECKGVESG
jgi:hypothetical protein